MKQWFKNKLAGPVRSMSRSNSNTTGFMFRSQNVEDSSQHNQMGTELNFSNQAENHSRGRQPQMANKSQLPINFAGRVLKLEMSLDKGINYVTMDDVNNLMELYTQAVEYYDSSYEEDRQKYYQQKLVKLMHSPLFQKLSQGGT